MARTILHSDLNAFYASVEMALDPTLRRRPIAVCGSSEMRHGIVLAKSDCAKKAGVKTGMVIWEAKRRCPELLIVPPHFSEYSRFSRLTRSIYQAYTDQVEPFGLDECWLDVTGSRKLFGSGQAIADTIRAQVRDELALTVSVGVSFTKTFAKLGSDLKKPDATVLIPPEEFRKTVWPLPVNTLLFIGPHITEKLRQLGVFTIHDLAKLDPQLLHHHFGKNGGQLWACANGLDTTPVARIDEENTPKSVGRGVTGSYDITTNEEACNMMLRLSHEVAPQLRAAKLAARGVQICVKDTLFATKQFQTTLPQPTQLAKTIAACAGRLFCQNYKWNAPVRSLTVRAIQLTDEDEPRQLCLFPNEPDEQRTHTLEKTADSLHTRFGKNILMPASFLLPSPLHEPLENQPTFHA